MKTQIFAFTLLALTACGSGGFTPISESSCVSGNCAKNIPNGPQSFTPEDFQGTVVGGSSNQTKVIGYDSASKIVTILIPLLQPDIQFQADVPQISGASVSVGPNSSGLWFLTIKIPATYVLGRLGFNQGDIGLDPTKLPNGQPIPVFAGGEPPVVAFRVPRITQQIYIYAAKGGFAVFYVTPKIDPFISLVYPIKNTSKSEIIGWIGSVPATLDGKFSGGFYTSFVIPARIAAFIDDVI